MTENNLDAKIDLVIEEIIDLRRHIHAHPELSGLEHQTAILIAGYLKKIGWNIQESVGRTGLIAEFGPSNNGFIGLRVDMDALPIHENTNLEFSSNSNARFPSACPAVTFRFTFLGKLILSFEPITITRSLF